MFAPIAELFDHANDCDVCDGAGGWHEISVEIEYDEDRPVGNVRTWTPCPLLRRPNRRPDDRANALDVLNAR